MANIPLNSVACGDYTVGSNIIGGYDGTTSITTTTSTSTCDLLIDGTSFGTSSGDFTLTTTSSGNVSTQAGGYYGYGYDKSMISGKDGEILMDMKNMKFKVYSDDTGWIEYDMEDFSTKNKKVELNGSKDISVMEIITERRKRTVLVEKMPKTKLISLHNGIWIDYAGTNNIALGQAITINTTPLVYNYPNFTGFNIIGGQNNNAIGISNGVYYGTGNGIATTGNIAAASGTNTNVTNTAVKFKGATNIKGNATIEGNLTIDGDLTVNGGITINGFNNSNAAITINS